MNDELRGKFAELDEDLQEVQGDLAEQIADLRRQIRKRDEFQSSLLSWLVTTTRLLLNYSPHLTYEERKSIDDGWDAIVSKSSDLRNTP